MKDSLFVASPCYNGSVHVSFMKSVLELQKLCDRLDIDMKFHTIHFDSLVPRARNVCANDFLVNNSHDYLMFIDADIQFSPVSIIKMMKSDKDIICGAYPKKILNYEKLKKYIDHSTDISDLVSMSTNYAINYQTNNGSITVEKDLVEVKDAPTGFLLIKREVLQKLVSESVVSEYKNDIHAYGHGKKFYEFFPCGVFDGRYLSEDYGFCRLCQKVGYKIYCDLSVKLNHIGQFYFSGNIMKQLQNQNMG